MSFPDVITAGVSLTNGFGSCRISLGTAFFFAAGFFTVDFFADGFTEAAFFGVDFAVFLFLSALGVFGFRTNFILSTDIISFISFSSFLF